MIPYFVLTLKWFGKWCLVETTKKIKSETTDVIIY